MAELVVDTAARTLTAFGKSFPCAIGRAGATPDATKREGDGMTPLGRFPIRAALLRPDRIAAPVTRLPWRWLRPHDGWSDDPADPAYNRPVHHPHPYSAERLWRDDGLYDVIVVIGHNDTPPVAGHGSAVFLHCRHPDGRPTDGCIAIDCASWLRLLPKLSGGSRVVVR